MYEEMIPFLKNNHFYPNMEVKGDVITGLQIECGSIILMEERCTRIRDVLKDYDVTVSPMKNLGYIAIKINKKVSSPSKKSKTK